MSSVSRGLLTGEFGGPTSIEGASVGDSDGVGRYDVGDSVRNGGYTGGVGGTSAAMPKSVPAS